MKKIYIAALISFLTLSLFAQTPTKYWVQFTNKGNNPYSLSTPSAYLSPRALARRTAHGIPIDSLDLPVTPSYVAGVAAIPNVTVHSVSKWLNGVVIFTTDTNTLAQIASLPYVTTVGNVGLRHANTNSTKFSEETFAPVDLNSERTGSVESSTLNYGPSYNQINMLGGVCLHNAGFRGQGMEIAIIDAGFYHADQLPVFDTLFQNNRILGTWDFVMNEASVYEDNQHGAMVLSTMGGNLPGQLVGTAPDASFWLLRSEDAPTENLVEEYYWSCAAEYADSVGADVINSSLGYNQFDDPSNDHTYADMNGHTTPCSRAANFAARKGMAVVVSAGNSGQSPWFYIGCPADADSALTVAATDASGVVTGFSSRGSLTLFGHQKPDVGAQGQAAVICDPFGTGTQTGNGTSFSSPITCGLVACLWQAHPSFTNMQVLQTIKQSASQFSSPDSLLGYGIPDFCAANLYLSGNPLQLGNADQLYSLNPNPFTDNLNFSFYSTVDQNLSVILFDVEGRQVVDQLVFAAGNAENKYKLTELSAVAPGVYFLRVNTEAGNYFTAKVVKGN
ncbi:MAG TPA: S8 family serine peptidase [Bacteroidia bacterium]|nr:S8 family serine peptidase [Bacteroidia bacterium]